MHLLEGLDLGRSVNYYDGKVKGKEVEKRSSWRELNPQPQDHEVRFYRCATTAAQVPVILNKCVYDHILDPLLSHVDT